MGAGNGIFPFYAWVFKGRSALILVYQKHTTVSLKDKITSLECEIEDLSEYPDCPTEDIEFDGEDDFCNK